MSDEQERAALEAKAEETEYDDEDDEVGSPFDHPAFLPVLLVALAVWFGFDGWFSTTIEAVNFNRYGFFFLVGGAAYFALAELTTLPYLMSLVWGAFALWLGSFSLFGGEDDWWREDKMTILFNQGAAAFSALVALVAGVREMRRGDKAPEAPDA